MAEGAQEPLLSHARVAVARTLPAVFLSLSVIYLVGAVFLPFTLRWPEAPYLTAACVAMGLGLLWFAAQARRGRVPLEQAQPLSAILIGVVSTQTLLYQILLPQQPAITSIFMLTVGSALLVVERRHYVPLALFLLAEWALLPLLGHPVSATPMAHWTGVGTAAIVGAVAHVLRWRGLRRDAQAAVAFEARGRELQTALQEAREAAEALRAFSASAEEGMVIHRDGALVAANDAFWAMFRFTPGQAMGGMGDWVAPESRALVARRMQEHLEGPAEITMVRGDGTRFPARVSAHNIVYAGLPARLAIVRDLTQAQAEAARRRQSEEADRIAFERLLEIQQLRRLDEFKTQFLNTASHELNTPITPVRLQLHLLRAGTFGPLRPEQSHSLDVIDRNVARLAVLVQDLLDVARLQGGQLRLQSKPADLRVLAQQSVDGFAPQAAAKGVTLELRPGPACPVVADGRRIAQVVDNLLSNAVKFTPAGGRVQCAVASEGRHCVLEVTDTGPGLDASQMARLFQPFSQVHEDPAMRDVGTGLGLYICRGIVEAHGGRLSVRSEGRGKGSTFVVELPLRDLETQEKGRVGEGREEPALMAVPKASPQAHPAGRLA